MHDIESEVFTAVAVPLREKFKGIFVTGEKINAPSKFPAVSIYESDNYPSPENIDNGISVKFSNLQYRVDIYSNKTKGRKGEAKEIFVFLDSILFSMNFIRSSRAPLDDMGEGIYHLVATYRVKTDGAALYKL